MDQRLQRGRSQDRSPLLPHIERQRRKSPVPSALHAGEQRLLLLAHEEQAIYLSSLFSWYEGDFLDWYKREFPESEPNVLDCVRLYVSESRAEGIARVDSYEIRFTPYDWRLNDRVAD